jgi:hypothetical protein
MIKAHLVSMKKILPVLCLGAFIPAVPSISSAALMETFDKNASNWQVWTVNNGGGQKCLAPTYNSIGGNTGGYISTTVSSVSDRIYDFQPADGSIFGDLTGQNLSVDFKIDGLVTNPDGPKVRFYVGSYEGGNNYFVSNDTFSWDPNMDIKWATHQVKLNATNFVRWPNCDANSKTFDQVLAKANDIGLVFTGNTQNFNNNSYLGLSSVKGATLGIDNFGTVSSAGQVPEPATLLLLTLGVVSYYRRTR